MKISIITPCFNSARTIRQTIESIINQTYKDLEYIIIDNCSTDETLDIINEYQVKFHFTFLSEPDKGLYDAMNKGLRLATGEIVGILNSDDLFYSNKTLTKVAQTFDANTKIDAVYGDLIYFKNNDINKIIRYWRAGEYNEKRLNNGWIIPHPALFIKKNFYANHSKWFNPDFKLAGDYEMILRFLKIYKMRVKYLPEILTKMRAGGVSDQNLKQRQLGWRELKKAWIINNLKLPFLFIIRIIIFKIHQLFLHFYKKII
ncbi:MAG: glycosyltransferase family 2 protein [Patescibacteria group bacterium]